MRIGRTARRVLWVAAVGLLVGLFAAFGRGDGKPPTNEERVAALAEEFACPECSGQSVASSDAPAAVNIRRAVTEMVGQGATDDEVRALVIDRFGERVRLVPASEGLVGMVWVVPVVVAVVSVAAIVAVLLQWRRSVGDAGEADAGDRELVDRFLAEREELTESEPFR